MTRASLLLVLLTACAGARTSLPAAGPQRAADVLARALARPLPKTMQGLTRVEQFAPQVLLSDVQVGGRPVPVLPGRARHVHRGDDVTVVAWGATVPIAERAAAALDAASVGVDLIDLRSIAPWDLESVVASVARTRRLVVVHEDVVVSGTA